MQRLTCDLHIEPAFGQTDEAVPTTPIAIDGGAAASVEAREAGAAEWTWIEPGRHQQVDRDVAVG
jgi:hypothetical protein